MPNLSKLMPLVGVMAVALSACGGGDNNGGSTGSSGGSTSTGGTTAQSVDVTPCLAQPVAGRTVAGLVVPDVIQLNMAQPSGFPNGRKLLDPVVDVTLAVLFLNLNVHGADTFAKIPLDPSGNDVPYPEAFPWLAPAQGTAPAAGAGSGFVFRTDLPASYTRVDRMGMPAVATALVSSTNKNAYNDDTPQIDATGKWAPELTATLKGLTTALADDLTALKLTPCAKIS
jgi:hypothetical protein